MIIFIDLTEKTAHQHHYTHFLLVLNPYFEQHIVLDCMLRFIYAAALVVTYAPFFWNHQSNGFTQ